MKTFKKIGIMSLSLSIIIGINAPVVEATVYISNNVEYRSGLRLNLDGVDEAGKSGNDPTGNTDTAGTISCRINLDTVDNTGIVPFFGMGGDDTDQATNFGQLLLGVRDNATFNNRVEVFHRIDNSATTNRFIGNTSLSAATEYMITLSSSGTAWKIYVNDTLQSLTLITGANTGDWFGDVGTVGTRHYGLGNLWRDGAWASQYLDGKIDDCMTWSSQLSDAEVITLYNGGKPIHPCHIGLCTNLQNLWNLGEEESGTVTTMYDVIGTGTVDHFTMENMENADIVTTSYY